MQGQAAQNQQQTAPETNGTGNGQQQQAQAQAQAPAIDYGKIQQMLNGTLEAKENTALKRYFEQQGLSQQEAEQAIKAFKAEREKNKPDAAALARQAEDARKQARQAQVERDALLLAGDLGVDLKTMPYVLKLADLSGVTGDDGKTDGGKLKEALEKVLADIPQLKPQTDAGANGFRQIGIDGQAQAQAQTGAATARTGTAVPAKKWNRWNN